MLKYSISNDEGSFSPSHLRQDSSEALMKETIDVNVNPRSRAKMVMKKRAKNVQKRGNDYSALFPPISRTPQNQRKDVTTPYINPSNDLESPYINALGISRVNDVSSPYIMHSQFTKIDFGSPLGQKEYTRITNISQNNVVEVSRIKKDHSFSHENVNKVGASSPFIERRSRLDYNKRKNLVKENTSNNLNRSPPKDGGKDEKLQIQSNQMGLVQRTERHKTFFEHKNKTEEQFSIRKKIEQFRKWHEEQYKDKLKRLKEEVDNQFEVEHRKTQKSQLGENSPTGNNISGEKKDRSERKNKINSTRTSSNAQTPRFTSTLPPSSGDDKASSERTWHTWRDVNESYAYSNVKKYIEENELMNKEKEEWIQKWITDVDLAMQSDDSEESLV